MLSALFMPQHFTLIGLLSKARYLEDIFSSAHSYMQNFVKTNRLSNFNCNKKNVENLISRVSF